MLIAYDETVAAHLRGVRHPERPERVLAVAAELERRALDADRVAVRPATEAELARVHPPAYVDLVRRSCEALASAGAAMLATGDTVIDEHSYDAAVRAAGAVLAALDRVDAERRAAFALTRPPGHHAEPAAGMGFCVFNHAALAARSIANEGGHALVVDFDYHHGNGTEAAAGAGVSYFGSHADPAYPGTGDPRANRIARDGAVVNVALDARGAPTEGFLALHARALRTLAARLRPTHLIVSAGYDVVAGDPVGDLGVDARFAREMGRLLREIAVDHCDGRALFILEGGYDPATLARCVADTIEGYDDGVAASGADAAAIPARAAAVLRELDGATAVVR